VVSVRQPPRDCAHHKAGSFYLLTGSPYHADLPGPVSRVVALARRILWFSDLLDFCADPAQFRNLPLHLGLFPSIMAAHFPRGLARLAATSEELKMVLRLQDRGQTALCRADYSDWATIWHFEQEPPCPAAQKLFRSRCPKVRSVACPPLSLMGGDAGR
jgi:hypothetical protein